MSLTTLISRPCTIIRRSEVGDTDEYGNEIPAEEAVDAVWELQQRRRSEADDQGEVSETDWVAFFLPEVEIGTGDSVVDGLEGHIYEVVGEPWRARNPRTSIFEQIEVTLRRVASEEDAS